MGLRGIHQGYNENTNVFRSLKNCVTMLAKHSDLLKLVHKDTGVYYIILYIFLNL